MVNTNDEELIKDYLSNMSLTDICEKHKIKVHIIYTRLKKHNILTKSHPVTIVKRITEKFPDHDFTNSDFVNEHTPITIVCRKHGEFKYRPVTALREHIIEICRHCKDEKRSNQFNFLETIPKLEHVDYSEVVYKNARTKVKITCKYHGEKFVRPSALKNGSVCRECGTIKGINSRSLNYERCNKSQFMTLVANRKDVDSYSYDNVPKEFFLHSTIELDCKFHGKFKQEARQFLNGKGCFKCYCSLKRSWSRTAFKQTQKGRPLKFYIICIYNSNELFYKVGLTFQSLKRRLGEISARYKTFPVFIIQDMDVDKMFSLEKTVLKYLTMKKIKYKPEKKFAGENECFKSSDVELKNLYSFIREISRFNLPIVHS